MSTNTVARAIEQDCFCVPETTKGTAVFPTAAAQRVITAGTADINQQANFSDSEEISNSLDVIERFQDQMGDKLSSGDR
jgi:transcriptional regulator of heat shock response